MWISGETHSLQSKQSPASQDAGTNSAVRRKAQTKALAACNAYQDASLKG